MATTQSAMSAGQMIQQNQILRAALLQSAPRMRKDLGVFTGGVQGGTSRVKLFNVGIITRLLLEVIVKLDIGVAVATPSLKAPFNLINRIKLTDYDGTDRVNCSGFQLWQLNNVRTKSITGYNNGSQTAVLPNPIVPTAVGANQTLQFQIEVPLAYDAESDLRGALLAQTAVGEAYVNIDWNTLLVQNGNADALYSGGATSTVAVNAGSNISVRVIQEYLLPQQVGNQVPIPVLDMMTVYEISGAARTADNIAANQEKLINYPNLRSVIGFYFNFMNNGVMNAGTDITKLKLIANGNNVLREYSASDKLYEQRQYMLQNADTRAGAYFEPHRSKPIETALFGNIQYSITPSSVSGANTNFEICFESFYTKGSQLPGMTQGS